jgi:hypothetical protein
MPLELPDMPMLLQKLVRLYKSPHETESHTTGVEGIFNIHGSPPPRAHSPSPPPPPRRRLHTAPPHSQSPSRHLAPDQYWEADRVSPPRLGRPSHGATSLSQVALPRYESNQPSVNLYTI